MQTIKEAAKSVYKETTTHDEEVAFKRGVEFAQQFFLVEKELPFGECILVDSFQKKTFFDFSEQYDIKSYCSEKSIICWRPLNFL